MLVENACLRQELETAAVWPGACRFAACNSLPFETYRDLLAASSLVVCPREEEADIRPMLECMSCETLLMALAAAGTVLRPGITMLDFPGEASESRKKPSPTPWTISPSLRRLPETVAPSCLSTPIGTGFCRIILS